jgi:hypothetical protein
MERSVQSGPEESMEHPSYLRNARRIYLAERAPRAGIAQLGFVAVRRARMMGSRSVFIARVGEPLVARVDGPASYTQLQQVGHGNAAGACT